MRILPSTDAITCAVPLESKGSANGWRVWVVATFASHPPHHRCHAATVCFLHQRCCLPACLQINLAFAGPGAYAISWVTYPQQDPDLVGAEMAAAAVADAAAAVELEPTASAAAASGTAAAAGRKLSAAQQQQQDRQQQQKQQRLGRHHRRPKCKHVQRAGVRSVVQYGTEPGEYRFTGE